MPAVQTRPLVDPEVAREVSLVTVAGRRFLAGGVRFRPRDHRLPLPA
jgi:hypothetical protein